MVSFKLPFERWKRKRNDETGNRVADDRPYSGSGIAFETGRALNERPYDGNPCSLFPFPTLILDP